MKRVLAIILTGIMTVGMMIVSLQKEETKVEAPPKEIIETQTYYTDIDYSLLYSLKEQKTKKDIVELTYPEAVALMKIGRCEGGNTVDAQLAVMNVVINRIKTDNSDFKDIETVGEVIFQDGQFSTVETGAFENAELNTNSHIALALLESGVDLVNGALWFESSSNSDSSWHKRKLNFVCEIEGNLYYK